MKQFGLFFVFFCLIGTAAAQDAPKSDVAAESSNSYDIILKENPNIAKAYELWKEKTGEATAKYIKRLEILFEKEKSKGNLDAVKIYEKTVETAKTQHVLPCILFERLPQEASGMLDELNKSKSKTNKNFLTALEKETADILRKKGPEEAKKSERFLFVFFLPRSMETTLQDAIRHENKIFLFVDRAKTWEDARDWCMERGGDLVSIPDKTTNIFLYDYMTKRGGVKYSWIGGVKDGRTWVWTDGTPFSFTAWGRRQPDGGIKENRMAFGFGGTAVWDDGVGARPNSFLAQWILY